jgi:hypothetical protein
MSDPLDDVLQLVANGRLTADEAGPILEALGIGRGAGGGADDAAALSDDALATGPPPGPGPRALRIEVSESGRKVVNLRVPLALGRIALDRVPGLSADNITRIREALDVGMTGPILVVDDGADGDAVRIVLE